MAKLTRNEVIQRLSDSAGISISEVEALLASIVELAANHVSEGFVLPGMGQFVIAPGPDRTIRNPVIGEWITVPGNPMLTFIPDSEVSERFLAASPVENRSVPDSPNKLPVIRLRHNESDWTSAQHNSILAETANHKLGGSPDWIQREEVPICCSKAMTFYGQLDSGIGGPFNVMDSAMIFVFVCDDCSRSRAITQSY